MVPLSSTVGVVKSSIRKRSVSFTTCPVICPANVKVAFANGIYGTEAVVKIGEVPALMYTLARIVASPKVTAVAMLNVQTPL